ncbi:MAG: radical SAM protein [Planctomycetota bacterium]
MILGGANAMATAIVHGEVGPGGAGLVDAVLAGEAEHSLKQFLRIVIAGRERGASKREILAACHGAVDGYYEPDRYRHEHDARGKLVAIHPSAGVAMPVRAAMVGNLNEVRTLESAPVYYELESLGSAWVQFDQGCPCFCSFCREGWEFKPWREREERLVLESVKRAKIEQGADTVNISSMNFNMHSRLYSVLAGMSRLVFRVSMKSQRFDLLADDADMADFERQLGKSSITCGLEGISARLRRYLHKNLTEAELITAARSLFKARARQLKLFTIATGLEEQQDLDELRALLTSLKAEAARCGVHTRLILSLTPQLTMPNTPSQWRAARCVPTEADALVERIASVCRDCSVEFRTSMDGGEVEVAQLLLLGDRRLTRALVRSSLEHGVYFDQSVPQAVALLWRRLLAEQGIDAAEYFRARTRADVLPWQDIAGGVPTEFLWGKFLEMNRFAEDQYCLNRSTRKVTCELCDACDTPAQVLANVRRRIPSASDASLDGALLFAGDGVRVRVIIDRDPASFALPLRFFQVAAARALMKAFPDLALTYLRPGAHHAGDAGDDGLTGLACLELHFARLPPLATINAGIEQVSLHMSWARVLAVAAASGALEQPSRIRFAWRTDRALRELDLAIVQLLAKAHAPHTRQRHGEGYRYTVSPRVVHHAPARVVTVCADGSAEIELGRKRDFPHRLLADLDRRGLLKGPPRAVELAGASSSVWASC